MSPSLPTPRVRSPTEALSVNATSFVGGDIVTVSWNFTASGTATASGDQIQLFLAPAATSITTSYPLKFDTTTGTAVGSVT